MTTMTEIEPQYMENKRRDYSSVCIKMYENWLQNDLMQLMFTFIFIRMQFTHLNNLWFCLFIVPWVVL